MLLKAQGKYTVKDTNEVINYDYEYLVLEGSNAQAKIDFAISELGESKVATDIQRTLKVDANNIAREKAKTLNGHSTRQPLTEEQKAENKAKRSQLAEIAKVMLAKGLSLEDIKSL